ncbi:hypothetical protein BZARG_3098 [Bizionia argentinensis JUB59]|uniref:Uncharacterized protein n=1 Tax=Bizionia argentinensis JUB59 TaxID=1046627 RepID=G2EGG9_9FLAO|nr:hypothetical protein [Bizionia argentinensis]EGV42468.2 hypothetical protein BZARG_3098 [Bizionia argentinensis JUB59]
MQNIKLSCLPLTNKNELDINKLKEEVLHIMKRYNIAKLIFNYNRINKTTLIGVFSKFNFEILGYKDNEEFLIFKFNENRKKDLKNLLQLITLFSKETEIELINQFDNDDYFYDKYNSEIVRKIYDNQ